MVTRWEFYDPIDDETWVLPMNPHESDSPPRKKRITEEVTTSPDGQVVLFEGHDQVQRVGWAGKTHDKDTFDEWNRWFEKRHQIRLTDDLDRVMWIYIEEFTPKRVRSAIYPWKHTFDARVIILSVEAA